MKFLLDVCAASRSMRHMLIESGHDVLSAAERDPRATDEALLALAYEEQRVLVTDLVNWFLCADCRIRASPLGRDAVAKRWLQCVS